MPTEAVSAPALRAVRHPAAARRILRLALGTSLCLVCAEALAWPLSFVAPVLTLLILGLPLPAPSSRQGIVFIVALLTPLLLGMGLLPVLEHARWAGIALLALALFYSFLFTARGGSPLLGNFMTIGLTLVVTVGSVSPEVLSFLLPGLAMSAAFGLLFVWVAHALLPERPPNPGPAAGARPQPPSPSPAGARRSALRSLAVVLPLALLFLFSSASPAFTPVMIKVAALGQQASADRSREMGRSLFASTFWGGLGAVACWQLLSIWPSLLLYGLLIALAALLFGRWIFQGPALHPHAPTASYALLTLIIVLAPAVQDSALGSAAGAAFWTRLALFGVVAVYGTMSVAVFDAFWPARDGVEVGRSP